MSTTEQTGAARIDHVVVPGTFDPVTLGHMDVISRTRKLFPRVTVAVAASVNKRGRGTAFTLEERVEMLRQALAEEGLSDKVMITASPTSRSCPSPGCLWTSATG